MVKESLQAEITPKFEKITPFAPFAPLPLAGAESIGNDFSGQSG